MNEKTKVKIVKRTDVGELKSKKRKVKLQRNGAREMVANVTDWVTDLKQRKSVETKAAFDLLFSSRTRPSES